MSWIPTFFKGKYLRWNRRVRKIHIIDRLYQEKFESQFNEKMRYSS